MQCKPVACSKISYDIWKIQENRLYHITFFMITETTKFNRTYYFEIENWLAEHKLCLSIWKFNENLVKQLEGQLQRRWQQQQQRRQFTLMLVSSTPKTLPLALASATPLEVLFSILANCNSQISEWPWEMERRERTCGAGAAALLDLLSCHVHVVLVLVHLIYVPCVWQMFWGIPIPSSTSIPIPFHPHDSRDCSLWTWL